MFKFDFLYYSKYFDVGICSDSSTWSFGITLDLYPLSLHLEIPMLFVTIHWKDELAPGRV